MGKRTKIRRTHHFGGSSSQTVTEQSDVYHVNLRNNFSSNKIPQIGTHCQNPQSGTLESLSSDITDLHEQTQWPTPPEHPPTNNNENPTKNNIQPRKEKESHVSSQSS